MVFNPSIIINTGLLALSGTAQLIVPVLGALFWKHSTAAGAFTGCLLYTSIAYVGSMLVGNSANILCPDIDQTDKILPTVLYQYAPFVLASFIIACGAAAAMSTANSQIHAMRCV